VIRFTALPPYPSLYRRLSGPQSQSRRYGEKSLAPMVIEPRLFHRAAHTIVAILNDVYPTIVDFLMCSFKTAFQNLTPGTFCYRLETHQGSVEPKKLCILHGTLGLHFVFKATSPVAKLIYIYTRARYTQIARHSSTVFAAHYFSAGQAHSSVNLELTLRLPSPCTERRARNAKPACG
jgi:hypothetical protein